ncbi:MAG: chemotaxis protein CheW [Nitrospirota bacterium]|nr:chemotaxis protein CheW [Nitrospirota bacterium]
MTSATTEDVKAGYGSGTEQHDAEQHEFLTFALGGEEFGIPILEVQEIIGYQKPTAIPNAPEWVMGVINIRGVVIPVVDVRAVFGMGFKEYDSTSVIIVTLVDGKVIGAAVDEVKDVMGFTDAQMQAPPEIGGSVDLRFLSGMGKLDERLVMTLAMREVMGGIVAGADDLNG